MVDVAVVGGGPAGLSAGLYAAKNDLDTVVFDTDESWMHKAHLFNYPAIRSISGDEFLEVTRGQVEDRGADLEDAEVTAVEEDGDGFAVHTDDEAYAADYVVLATGGDRDLAEDLGCAFTDEDVVDVTVDMETSVEGVYATGAMGRAEKWQAVIAAGDGAAAVLDILSKEKGEYYHDFDMPSDVPDL
ncbi:FAD-dependent pyridine nucleotide-disulfide oxidoreductase [Halosimplex carlsbadense 2-9-1]|jgi:thioredoxin reductase (NADPH)|uniref:FAD-dependent pyridine nucleotide-disulfide oxidoreductase n=1 Tax=Halosimplex carlsbadense 2-9-1 TaxID=797114 RepID=M0CUS8_9EURY|nr:NAD(P)/FAD-dependent oxidoreductase [Halosimplex carlsbadense]ELZ26980.1 FAD-dependent pyridine nucleotide-disulfide oxidoreductase [Halosimplex carlsbadense 2-9-1]